MASDVIAWCFFELKDKSDVDLRDFDTMISKDDDISIESNLFIYNILRSSIPDNELALMPDEVNNITVIIDELYRPGYGVEHKRSFYGIWREDVDTTIAEKLMQQLMSSEYKSTDTASDDDGNVVNRWRKKKSNSEDGLLVTESEKWERRKDLTGVVLKITTNAVNRNRFLLQNAYHVFIIYK